jgi:SAM-dependent methyltransferase
MYEIYEQYAGQYDELVMYEDYQQNLKRLLRSLISWDHKIVIEAGIGTGRVTSLYIDKIKQVYGLDRSAHMLGKLKTNLKVHLNKIDLRCSDNLNLPDLPEKGDVFIEGWSFGHTISDNENDIEGITTTLVSQALRMTKENGVIIFIETLGSNSEIPMPPKESLSKFYCILEDKFKFKNYKIKTDYKFSSCAEAARITGFFFGNNFGDEILKSGKSIVPEWTGVWVLDNKKEIK